MSPPRFLTATVDVTTRCNLRCQHCRTRSVPKEMTLSEIEFVAGELARHGVRSVFLGGGEPLVRNDIALVVRVFKAVIPEITINTNGTLLTQLMLKELLLSGITCLQFSVDGLPAEHDMIRGAGQYKKVMAAIRLALRHHDEIEIHLSSCVSRLNVDGMDDFVAEIIDRERLPVDVICFKRFVPKNKLSLEGRLGRGGLGKLMKNVDRLSKKYESRVVIAMDSPMKNVEQLAYAEDVRRRYGLETVGCSAGCGPCIRADGEISPCSMMEMSCGNVFGEGIDAAYADERMKRILSRDLRGRCANCRSRLICGGCRAVAEAYSGDCLAEDPECCI